MSKPAAFLGVETSLSGRRWTGLSAEQDRLAEALLQETGLPDALCRVLARRGVAPGAAESFLAPTLRDSLPNPQTLLDMEPASARLVSAVNRQERIAVFADYDVDGGASAALLQWWLRALNHSATIYVPDRIDEGYGPNPAAMQALAAGHNLILCVDCGTLSHEAIAAAKGCDVVILDHHLGSETLPDALAVVNPNRQDESGELAHLCAASVVFLTLVAANTLLRAAGRSTPDLMQLLDLVALATVADVAPLIGVNRALVRQGLKIMGYRARPGLRALADAARLDTAPSSYHLGFVLGPRINAGGRIGQADLGARLLSTADEHEASALAERLGVLNEERREIETRVRAAALEQAEARGLDGPLVWAAGEGWHPGVVGIVASRLKEATNRPAVVIGFDGNEGKGSGRSVAGIDLGASVQRLATEGLLVKGGGHKMAAGLTVAKDRLEEAMERLGALLARQGADKMGPRDLRLDGIVMPGAVQPDLIAQIDSAGPFGASAPAPRFALPDMAIGYAKRVGESHLKLNAKAIDGSRIDAIAFGAFESPLGDRLANAGSSRFHLAGRLEINTWGGRQSVQLVLEDAASSV
ncbi:MAG: single-stranded-DNA-specific exonuclease RecJ [Dinoroseobacter sp.]|nr:single-stranded-DNA-specific exonuclease RecJ [Dinoroseobacter sp.]MDJ0993759.1 single-stranded-DNA-specific exonuclease RecJ [Dinoroseobacter sp.]